MVFGGGHSRQQGVYLLAGNLKLWHMKILVTGRSGAGRLRRPKLLLWDLQHTWQRVG